jgi:hypothetical protein
MDNDKQIIYIDIRQLRLNDDNPREIDGDMFRKLRVSLLLFDKMLRLRPIVRRDNKVVGGNMRLKSLQWIASATREDIAGLLKGFDGWEKKTEEERRFLLDKWAKWQKRPEVPTLSAYDFDADELEEFVAKDNISYGRWSDSILDKWSEKQLAEWGVGLAKFSVSEQPLLQPQEQPTAPTDSDTSADGSDYEKTMQELRAKLEAGEISEDDEEYQAFVSKFEAKKTTDDCYTPTNVYEAVVSWCEKEYGINRNKIVRPFYPGGDYEHYPYKEGDVVIDNPPFSILSKIMRFYNEKGIKYFLFAPTLTLFSSSSSSCTAIGTGVAVTYENGAKVNTSFVTNMNGDVRFRSCPELYRLIKEADDANLKERHKELPKCEYPDNVITSTQLAYLSKYGIEFSANMNETYKISALESQKEHKKAIFGSGYLVSDAAAQAAQAAREAAQAAREAAQAAREDKKTVVWEFSENERKIIEKLGVKTDKTE